jgi:hypothetical protein
VNRLVHHFLEIAGMSGEVQNMRDYAQQEGGKPKSGAQRSALSGAQGHVLAAAIRAQSGHYAARQQKKEPDRHEHGCADCREQQQQP